MSERGRKHEKRTLPGRGAGVPVSLLGLLTVDFKGVAHLGLVLHHGSDVPTNNVLLVFKLGHPVSERAQRHPATTCEKNRSDAKDDHLCVEKPFHLNPPLPY